MPGTIAPSPWFTGLDDNGNPLSGGLLYTYAAGTTTPATTYSDSTLATPNANPIVLDSAGRATIFLDATSYKFLLKTSAGVTVRTADNIQSVAAGAVSGLGEIFVFGGDPNTPVTATSYPVGAGFDKLHGGTSVFNIDSANLAAGTYVIDVMGVVVGVVTLTVAIVDLDDGAPDTPLATATITSTTGARARSGSITFAAAGSAKNYGIKVKISGGSGYAWGARLMRTA
jgi:hypothetical protein